MLFYYAETFFNSFFSKSFFQQLFYQTANFSTANNHTANFSTANNPTANFFNSFFVIQRIWQQLICQQLIWQQLICQQLICQQLTCQQLFLRTVVSTWYVLHFMGPFQARSGRYQSISKKCLVKVFYFCIKTLMKPSLLDANIFFSYFEIMAQFNDHNFFQIEQNLN